MSENQIQAIPNSYHTSELTPIIVEKTPKVLITFDGLQVDNNHSLNKNIKGKLVIKKKGNKNDDFNSEKFSRKDITANTYVEISLETDATYALAKGLFKYYQLFSGKKTNPYETVSYIKSSEELEKLQKILQDKKEVAELIANMDITVLNRAINVENLNRVYQEVVQHMDDNGETKYWQPFFEKNSWILSQLFHSPVMFFNGNRYVGGKGLNGKGGQYTDFIYKNDLTDNVSLIEIKTPVKKVIKGQYRQTYLFEDELIGAVNQLLLQRDELCKEYSNLLRKTNDSFSVNNIKCILLYGTIKTMSKQEVEAFENYRNELRNIQIITFDELLKKIENMLDLLNQ